MTFCNTLIHVGEIIHIVIILKTEYFYGTTDVIQQYITFFYLSAPTINHKFTETNIEI